MLERSQLYVYQQKAAQFIRDKENCALWVDVGLGKTVSTLTAFADLHAAFSARRALIVAPLRVARKVWSDEVASWGHLQGMSVGKIIGTPEERMAALRTPTDIHTINYEQMAWLEAQFLDGQKQILKWPWDTVVFDESQALKAQSSTRWKAARRLRRLFPRCLELTGTPAPNGYGDLWSQMYLLDQGQRLGATERAFEDRWFARTNFGQFSTVTLRDGSAEQIQTAVADIVMSLKEADYLDLPPVLKVFHKVTLSPKAMQTYRQMARQFTTEIGGKTLTAVNAGVLDGKLLQLANGVVYLGEDRQVVVFHDEKIEFLRELLDSVSGKLLVAYYYRHDLDRIKALLAASGRTWSVLKSDEDFERWSRGELDVGVLHPKSAGHGLNDLYKAGAEDLVHYGMTASLELEQQVNGRLTGGHRRQGKNIKLHYIVAEGTRDEDYVKILSGKDSAQHDLTRSLALRCASA